jgi:hypothetical protein
VNRISHTASFVSSRMTSPPLLLQFDTQFGEEHRHVTPIRGPRCNARDIDTVSVALCSFSFSKLPPPYAHALVTPSFVLLGQACELLQIFQEVMVLTLIIENGNEVGYINCRMLTRHLTHAMIACGSQAGEWIVSWCVVTAGSLATSRGGHAVSLKNSILTAAH